jgi:hypothetical protein
VREKDGCTRRSTRECFRNAIAALTRATAGRKIVYASHDQAGSNFGPAVAQQLEAGLLDQKGTRVVRTVELVVARDYPDTERCRKTAQDRKQFALGLAVPFKEISEEDH